jgi:precorrin-3B C17-methyltransferase
MVKYGTITIVGIGAGRPSDICGVLEKLIDSADVIICYYKYVDQIKELAKGQIISYNQGEELKRSEKAISLAEEGKRVLIISSGDPGIFGMAGAILSLVPSYIECEVIPGIPALSFAGAKLGSPIGGDFALVSLSDSLIPWNYIAYNLDNVAKADIPIVIINPGSRGRKYHLAKAMRIIARYRSVDTPVGVAENVGLQNEKVYIVTIRDLLDKEFTNQNTTIFVGCSRTIVREGKWMVTDRGFFKHPVLLEVDITKESYKEKIDERKFVEKSLEPQGFSSPTLEIILSVIEKTGDFSLASLIKIGTGSIEKILEIIRERPIYTDTDLSIITKNCSKNLNIRELKEINKDIEKSLVIINENKKLLEELVNNLRKIEIGGIIATTPGFEKIPTLKKTIADSSIPHIVIMGNKGGISVTLGIVEALIKMI